MAVGAGTSVGIAGGASESTNVILSRTNAFIEDSTIGNDTHTIGNVDLDATGTGNIDAVICRCGRGGRRPDRRGAAVGIAVRNFIGWDPKGVHVTPGYQSTSANSEGMQVGTKVNDLTPGMKVRIASGGAHRRRLRVRRPEADRQRSGNKREPAVRPEHPAVP